MRKLLLNLHLVGGLVSALFLIALGLSGALLVFQNEFDHTLNRQLTHVAPQGAPLTLDELAQRLESAHPQYRVSGLSLPASNDLAFNINLRPASPGKALSIAVNPYTGAELGSLETANTWMRNVHQFHTRLLLGDTGKLIVTWAAIFLAGLALSGLVLWWPRKLWRMSGATSGQKKNFELHNVLGFYSSIFMLLFALTAVVIHWDDEARQLVGKVVGEEPKTAPPQVAPTAPGAVPIKPDAALAFALQAVPGARVTGIQGLGAPGKPIQIWMKFPEDGTPAGRTRVSLDPVSGAVLFAQSSRTAPLAFRIVKQWNREIHTGDIFGWPTRIVAGVASLCLPLLALTGVLIWWGRVRRRRAAG